MPRLSREEQETIITFDATDAPAIVYTYDKSWQKHLEGKLGLTATRKNPFGGKTYAIDKKRIRMPLAPRKLTEAQRQKLVERGRALAQRKAKTSSKS